MEIEDITEELKKCIKIHTSGALCSMCQAHAAAIEILERVDEIKIKDIINKVSENQIRPYIVIQWEDGKSVMKTFGEFFSEAIIKYLKE